VITTRRAAGSDSAGAGVLAGGRFRPRHSRWPSVSWCSSPFTGHWAPQADGSGLGLPIVLEIAHQHHATVTVDETADPGQTPPGARFSGAVCEPGHSLDSLPLSGSAPGFRPSSVALSASSYLRASACLADRATARPCHCRSGRSCTTRAVRNAALTHGGRAPRMASRLAVEGRQ
jgi:hypothetical protein